MSKPAALDVFLYDEHVGELVRAGNVNTHTDFIASTNGVAVFGIGSKILSQSLALHAGSHSQRRNSDTFFDGLLPEGAARDALRHKAMRTATSTGDVFGLLAYNGGNMAGAVTVGNREYKPSYVPLSPAEYRYAIENPEQFLTDVSGGSSLGGFQEKFTLKRDGDDWVKAIDGAATTHILKPASTRSKRESVSNEAYNLSLARELGLLDYESWLEDVDDYRVLVIERFDRAVDGGDVSRIHQENISQAMGSDRAWSFRLVRDMHFERNNPNANLRNVSSVVKSVMSDKWDNASGDLTKLARYTVFNMLVGNTDAHIKNHGLIKYRDGSSVLAPLYDVPNIVLSDVGFDGKVKAHDVALNIGGKRTWNGVTAERLRKEFMSWGMPSDLAQYAIEDTASKLLAAVGSVDVIDGAHSRIRDFVQSTATNITSGRSVGLNIDSHLYQQASTLPTVIVVPVARAGKQRCGAPLPMGGFCNSPLDHKGRHRHQ